MQLYKSVLELFQPTLPVRKSYIILIVCKGDGYEVYGNHDMIQKTENICGWDHAITGFRSISKVVNLHCPAFVTSKLSDKTVMNPDLLIRIYHINQIWSKLQTINCAYILSKEHPFICNELLHVSSKLPLPVGFIKVSLRLKYQKQVKVFFDCMNLLVVGYIQSHIIPAKLLNLT